MTQVQITNFTIVRARPSAFASESLAFFDAEIGGMIRLTGCKIVRRKDGTLSAIPPAAKSRRNRLEPTAWFLDRALHREFADRAFAAYQALTGDSQTEAEPDNSGVMATIANRRHRARWEAYK